MNKNDNQADTSEVDESTEQPEAPAEDQQPEVELDRPTDVQGDLIDNPVLEEEDEPESTEPEAEPEAPETTPEEPVQTPEEEADGTPAVEPEEDASGVYSPPTTQDPGAFQPKGDYAFEVKTLDGKTVKVSTPEEADALAQRLDSEENLLGAYQFTQFQRNFLKMEAGIDREKAEYETQKAAYDQEQAQIEVRNQTVTQWNNEINYLRAKGMLPEITPQQNSSDWTDPTNAEVPAIKQTLEIFKWMEQENAARRQAGIADVTSAVDAYRMMQAEQAESAQETERQTEITTRQKKGAMIQGNSSFGDPEQPSNSIVGEGGSLQDLVREYTNSM